MGTVQVGNVSYDRVEEIAKQKNVVPENMTLTYDGKEVTLQTSQLGMRVDEARTRKSLEEKRSWLPIVAIFTKHVVAAPVAIDETQIAKVATQLGATFHKKPVDAKVVLKGTMFTVQDSQNGYDLDSNRLEPILLNAIDHGKTMTQAPITIRAPSTTKAKAETVADRLQKTLGTSVQFAYGSSNKKAAASDIAQWYRPAAGSYAIDDFALRTYIAENGVAMGVHARNLTDAVSRTKQALTNNQAAQISLLPYTKTKTIKYCVSSRGAGTAVQIPQLKETLASTYADLRGWSLDGQVSFKYATSGCEFTVWMASPDKMASFGAICDPYWNCEAEGNVVVNMDRWIHMTPAWIASGYGGVDKYRTMLINHETGHMLGFGHLTCPAAGQLAPVMMQQSISLGGCKFNIWPVQTEHTMLRRMLGL